MFKSLRVAVIAPLFLVLSTHAGLAVTVQLEVESEGEPVPNAQVSFETPGGEELALKDVVAESAPAQPEPPPEPESEPPPQTEQPAAKPAQPPAKAEPEPETAPMSTPPAETEVTRVETDASGRAEVEIDEEYRDAPVFVVVRKDGKEVSRQRVALTGDPVRIRIDVPSAQLARASKPAETPQQPAPPRGPSFSVYGKGGTMDRGQVSFLRTEIGGIVVNAKFAEVDRDDEFYGVGGEATLPLGTLGLGGLSFGLNAFVDGFWGTSDVNENLGDVSADGNELGILGPEGPGGPLGGGLITAAGAGDLTDARYSDDYEEFLIRVGLSGSSFGLGDRGRDDDDPLVYFTPRIAFLYGHTDENGRFSGSTNFGTVSFEYENELDSDRFGGELGTRIDVPLSNHFGFYLDGGLRVTYDDADGSTSLESDSLGVPFPSERQDYSDSGWHVGGTIGAGLSVTYRNVTGSLGVEYENWKVPAPRVTGTEPASLDFERRESLAGMLRLRIDF